MPTFPKQGQSINTWGTELRDFFSPHFNLTSGSWAGTDPIIFPNGTAAAPGLASIGDTDTGFFWDTDGQLSFSAAGIIRYNFATNRIDANNNNRWGLRNEDSSATNPVILPRAGSVGTGMGSNAADEISLIVNSIEAIRLAEAAVAGTTQALFNDGTAAAPSIAFSGSTGTGFFQSVSNRINVSLSGTEQFFFSTPWFLGTNATGMGIANVAAASTTATFFPNRQDTDTGIGWTSADVLSLVAGGTNVINVSTIGTYSGTATGWRLSQGGATSTTPTFIPNRDDTNTGVGWTSADRGALVAGGVMVAEFMSTISADPQVMLPTGGSVTLPTLAFGDGDSGFYEASDDTIIVSLLGAQHTSFALNGSIVGKISNAAQIRMTTAGTVSSPSYTFVNDGDTGIYPSAANKMAITAGGVLVSEFTSTLSTDPQTILPTALNGNTLPTLAFGDGDTGFYENTDDDLRLSIGTFLRHVWDVQRTRATNTLGWALMFENSSDTNPTLIPNRADEATGWGAQATGNISGIIASVETIRIDGDATAGNTRFMIYDVDNATLERVSVGAADSGGSGYKVLRIPN